MNDMAILPIVFACAAVNYLIRVSPFLMTQWDRLPRAVRRFLTIMPTAALGALIFPGALTSLADTGKSWTGLGGLVAAVVATRFSKNLIVPVAAAVLTVWALLQIPT